MGKLFRKGLTLPDVDVIRNMEARQVQKSLVDNYFGYLQEYGYLAPHLTAQVLTATMLLHAVGFFGKFITDDFKKDLAKFLSRLDCCNCLVDVNNFEVASREPFYVFIPEQPSVSV